MGVTGLWIATLINNVMGRRFQEGQRWPSSTMLVMSSSCCGS